MKNLIEESSEKIKELVDTDFLSLYETLNREEKRMFWHGLLKEIKIDSECNIKEVVFLQFSKSTNNTVR